MNGARFRAACAFLLLAVTPAVTGAVAAEAPCMRVDPSWPATLPHDWILGQVSGVAVDAKDNVWIVQRPGSLTEDEKGAALQPPRSLCCMPAPPVLQFDPAGRVLRAWGGPGKGYDWFSSEHGIYIDPKGFVWLGGNGTDDGQVLKFTQDGSFVLQIGHPARGPASNDVTRLGRPADIAVDPSANEVYIADGYANRRIIVFDADTGAYKRHWGAYGTRPVDKAGRYDPDAPPARQFGTPVHCVKLAQDGLVYVCDRQNDRVQVFRKDGSFVAEWRIAPRTLGMGSVWDLALSRGTGQTLLFNADGENNQVRILLRDNGTVLGAFGRSGRQAGQFHSVHNLAIDSHDNLFTTEVDSAKRVQRFTPCSVR
jgi:DNA-binding beta-propeller fold protein YncE